MTKIALSILLLLTLSACSENTPAAETKSYQVVHPIITDTVYEREYATTINSLQNVEIRNKVRGFIEEIYVDEGQKVQTGQTLFTLNSKELEQQILKAEASIQSAQAELKGVEIEYDNTKKLFEKNIVAKSAFSGNWFPTMVLAHALTNMKNRHFLCNSIINPKL